MFCLEDEKGTLDVTHKTIRADIKNSKTMTMITWKVPKISYLIKHRIICTTSPLIEIDKEFSFKGHFKMFCLTDSKELKIGLCILFYSARVVKFDKCLAIHTKVTNDANEAIFKNLKVITYLKAHKERTLGYWNPSIRFKDIVKNDIIVVHCQLTQLILNGDNGDKSDNYPFPVYYNFTNLFDNEWFSDVTIKVVNREFKAHKIILASQSTVFLAMFRHNMLEAKEEIINITDVEPVVFADLLRFIYTGTMISLNTYACELLMVSDKYDIIQLKEKCMKEMEKSITYDNAVEMLIVADQCQAGKLKDALLDFIMDKPSQITATERNLSIVSAFPELTQECVSRIIIVAPDAEVLV